MTLQLLDCLHPSTPFNYGKAKGNGTHLPRHSVFYLPDQINGSMSQTSLAYELHCLVILIRWLSSLIEFRANKTLTGGVKMSQKEAGDGLMAEQAGWCLLPWWPTLGTAGCRDEFDVGIGSPAQG